MIVKSLDHIPFESIIDCLLLAFKNYFVEMPKDIEFYEKRWSYAKVDLKLSYGMFDRDKLVGFIINGIDFRDGENVAYNTGTGVIPKYRGQNIVKQIYDYAIPELKKNGITKCLLEVITENSIAIKSYERIGFKITRTLKCYKGELHLLKRKIQLIEKALEPNLFNGLPNQGIYSWDNHQNSVLPNPNFKLYELVNNSNTLGFFILNKANGYVAQFDVLDDNPTVWNDLFYGIQTITNVIKTNNIDSSCTDKIEILSSLGIENAIDQYEMEFSI